MKTLVHDVACTLCGCVCDDLTVEHDGRQIVSLDKACPLAEPVLLAIGGSRDAVGDEVAFIDDQAVPLEQALDRAAEILAAAHAPLLYGLSRSSTPGQKAATRLADRLGAIIDTTASTCHAPSIMALQEVGESTCTLGEARHRADLVIYWGSNPVVSHPRHLERYGVEPRSLFVPRGRADRHLVVVDTRPTETTSLADTFIQVAPDRDFELLWTLRCLVRGVRPGLFPDCGVAPTEIESLAARLMNCRSGIVYFGTGMTQGATGHRTVEALLRLVTDLNRHTRFYARRMRVYGDVAGADSVLCWQTGFPFSVSLSRGYPRYNPGEYSANDVLRRDEADACLLVGSEGVQQLSAAAQRRLRQIPVIALDYPGVEPSLPVAVRFTTAIYGVHAAGTAYRMDEVPIPLRAFLPSHLPTDQHVLAQLDYRVAKRLA